MVRTALLAALATLAWAAPARAVLVYEQPPPPDSRGVQNGVIVAARDDGSRAHALAVGQAPAVSPDGRYVAYIRRLLLGPAQLRVVPTRGGRSRLLLRDAFVPTVPAWSANSRYVLSGGFGGADAIDVRSGARTRFASSVTGYGGGALSPDGSTAVVVSVEGGGSQTPPTLVLYSASLRPRGHLRRVVRGDFPVWGSRGLAYLGTRGVALRTQLFQRLALRLPGRGWPVAWSADGTRLLLSRFIRRVGITTPSGYEALATYRASIVDVRTRRVTRLPQLFSTTSDPTDVGAVYGLSRDGRRVLARIGNDVVVARADGTTRVLARDALGASWAR